MEFIRVKYRSKNQDFHKELNKRVNHYFKSNNISSKGNYKMWIKTGVMLTLYFTPFILILTGAYVNTLMFFALWVIMGLGLAGIGLSVMHDANHGAYSKNKTVNLVIGKILDLVGGFAMTWKIQHNVLHHTYTNIEGMDEDIEPGPFLRFSPHKPKRKIHRFQHFYVWFLYGLMTLSWTVQKDFTRLYKYHKNGLLSNQQTTYGKAIWRLILSKAFYIFYILVIPILFVGIPWGMVVLGFLLMHFTGGLILACVFQPAHVMETSEYTEHENHEVHNSWAVQQMRNTCNFATSSKWFTWFVGGLNHQIEHHLFPHICHIHYRNLSKIVREVAAAYQLPYYTQPTFAHALHYHARMLKQLGR